MTAFRIHRAVLAAQDPEPREAQHDAEQVLEPVESAQQRCPSQDEGEAQDDCAQDAPEGNAVLVLRRHAQGSEDRQEDEEIVDAQRVLDDLAGHELEPVHMAEREVDCEREAEGQRDPERAHEPRHPARPFDTTPVHHAEVQREHQNGSYRKTRRECEHMCRIELLCLRGFSRADDIQEDPE